MTERLKFKMPKRESDEPEASMMFHDFFMEQHGAVDRHLCAARQFTELLKLKTAGLIDMKQPLEVSILCSISCNEASLSA